MAAAIPPQWNLYQNSVVSFPEEKNSIQYVGRPSIHSEAGKGRMSYPGDFDEHSIRIFESVKPFTMTSPERVLALHEAVKYLVSNGICGSLVECGVWRGGSAMVILQTLMQLGDTSREIFLYDTFTGMTMPGAVDMSIHGEPALEQFSRTRTSDDSSDWCFSSLEEVKQNVLRTGYSEEKIHFIQGKVEKTIPGILPGAIALLRLDTDWYDSTRHEMAHLFPLLQPGGVLIIDDYGFWKGARKAVDEYICENHLCLFLNRIDDTGRLAVKLPGNRMR